MNRYQFDIINESSKNTNFKPDINKLDINKKCQFLENIVIRDIRTVPEWIL